MEILCLATQPELLHRLEVEVFRGFDEEDRIEIYTSVEAFQKRLMLLKALDCVVVACMDSRKELEEICSQNNAYKVSGLHCYEMLLGSDSYEQIMAETAGTYFLEIELIVNFKEYCLNPLELYDREMRESFFNHYKQLIYVRQPTDPDLRASADELARFLNLSLDIINADYSHLEKRLISLLQP